jgi:hypothetical protein
MKELTEGWLAVKLDRVSWVLRPFYTLVFANHYNFDELILAIFDKVIFCYF